MNKIKIIIGVMFIFFLVGCGNKVDEEAVKNLSDALEKRWEYTESISGIKTIDSYRKATEIELNELNEYDIDDFKDKVLYSLLSMYKTELTLMKSSLINADIKSESFVNEWNERMAKRAKILHDINSKYPLDISDNHKETFEHVLSSADHLIKADEVKDVLSDIKALEGIDVLIEDNSVAINFHTESVLSADSFVSQKTGFPSKAMEILKTIKDYDFENIVVSTTNQDIIAISTYFTNESLKDLDFNNWEKLDSYDAHKFYRYSDAYHIRLGIWENLDEDTKKSIGNMNKQNSNPFWSNYGFTH